MSVSDKNLTAASIRSLRPGTVIQEDIYAFDSTMLIIERGTLLDETKLERLKNLNKKNDLIYITSDGSPTKNRLDTKREALEEEAGYTTLINETVEFFAGIANAKTIENKAIESISHELSNRLETTSPSVILSLINALAPVDEYLQRHCVNTSLLNGLMGKWLGLSKNAIDRLILIGLLHDCGKALMPPSLLGADRRLTTAEFEVIKMHTIRSYELLSAFPEPIRRAARSHHEKVNGRGYPDKLYANNIPAEARITALADIYDAMVSRRSYKEPRSPFSIMAIISKLGGEDLDPKLVNLFLKNMPSELVGKEVFLSDGRVGVVSSYDLKNIEYPVVDINGKQIQTNQELYCTYMC